MRKLAYTNGYAIIVESIEEVTSEYHVERKTIQAEVVFRTAVGIKRFCDLMGTKTISKDTKKRLLEQKKKLTTVSYHCYLDFDDLPVGTPLWYNQRGFHLSFNNAYSDNRIYTNIPVTREGLAEAKKDKEFKKYWDHYYIGPSADATEFKNYVMNFVKSKNVISTR